MLQKLLRDLHMNTFFICCKQAQNRFCVEFFYKQFFIQNKPFLFFWNTYSLSDSMYLHIVLFTGRLGLYHVFVRWFLLLLEFLDDLYMDHLQGWYNILKFSSPFFFNSWKCRGWVPIDFYEFGMNFVWC